MLMKWAAELAAEHKVILLYWLAALCVFATLTAGKYYVSKALLRAGNPGGLHNLALGLASRLNFVTITLLSLTVASLLYTPPPSRQPWVAKGFIIAVGSQVAIWADLFIDHWSSRQGLTREHSVLGSVRLAAAGARIVVWSAIALATLDNLGVNITALVAGLGIGGIAAGLALQNILSDLFASLAIVLDKPFVVGDFIIFGEEMGTVESIGLKTTRVRSLSGEQIICSNSDLLGSRIRNFKRMSERRIQFCVGIAYETPADRLTSIVSMIARAVAANASVRLERCHLKELSASCLNIEIVYWVTSADYGDYMDVQQSINIEILRLLARECVEIAYPTQALWLRRTA